MPDIVLTTLNAKYAHAAFGLRYLMANLGALRDAGGDPGVRHQPAAAGRAGGDPGAGAEDRRPRRLHLERDAVARSWWRI